MYVFLSMHSSAIILRGNYDWRTIKKGKNINIISNCNFIQFFLPFLNRHCPLTKDFNHALTKMVSPITSKLKNQLTKLIVANILVKSIKLPQQVIWMSRVSYFHVNHNCAFFFYVYLSFCMKSVFKHLFRRFRWINRTVDTYRYLTQCGKSKKPLSFEKYLVKSIYSSYESKLS